MRCEGTVLSAALCVVVLAACADVRDVGTTPEAIPVDGATDVAPAPEAPPDVSSEEEVDTSPTSDPVFEAAGCTPGPVPSDLDVDLTFYTQGCVVLGHPLLAPAEVDPAALVAAGEILLAMLGGRTDLAEVMASGGARTTIVGQFMGITQVPEYADLRDDPDMDWDARSRGFGGQPAFEDWPASPGSAGEEDVLCLDGDRYAFESIMVHEFAHTVWDTGVLVQDPSMDDRLWELYDAALAAGTWADTYAEETVAEYWAEGAQSYFDANDWAEPANGIHGWIDTNAELLSADPGLHALVDEVFGGSTWRWSCQ